MAATLRTLYDATDTSLRAYVANVTRYEEIEKVLSYTPDLFLNSPVIRPEKGVLRRDKDPPTSTRDLLQKDCDYVRLRA